MAVPYAAEAGKCKRFVNGEFEMYYDPDENTVMIKPQGARFDDVYTKEEIDNKVFSGIDDLTLDNLRVKKKLQISEISPNNRDVYTKPEVNALWFLQRI
jgi:hypothetical protein